MVKKKDEFTLEELPVLEYTLRRWATNLANKLNLPDWLANEVFDEVVERKQTYYENKKRLKEHLSSLAKHKEMWRTEEDEKADEIIEEVELKRSINMLISTLTAILDHDTTSDYYKIAKEVGLMDYAIYDVIKLIRNLEDFAVSKTYVQKLKSSLDLLASIELTLKSLLTTYGNIKLSDVVELLGREQLEEPLEIVETLVEPVPEFEKMSESEYSEYIINLSKILKRIELIKDLRKSYEEAIKYSDIIKAIWESYKKKGNPLEAHLLVYQYKLLVYTADYIYGRGELIKWLIEVRDPNIYMY